MFLKPGAKNPNEIRKVAPTGFEPVHEDAMSRRILPSPRRLIDRSELSRVA
jgi:hypothetical protein